ncbi:hypothetical protein [Phormidium sp. CCY1219]|uniref:hypothetical protein n=1 Tax=Phormidium sp. CCY1219 TaxID=2886104 RepID=UPI002D1E5ABB|nr:hypothetical protein [Phormidium sp. CCY1219]MEB3831727.1 hypothetical protein [Phormidium sp. CCY1219]
MNRLITWLKGIRLRQIIAVSLATIALMFSSAFAFGSQNQAQAAKLLTPEDNPEQVDRATAKRVQEKAEDFPNENIGDTGLKNIRKLNENIPKVIEQNAEETLNPDNPDAPGTRNPNQVERR